MEDKERVEIMERIIFATENEEITFKDQENLRRMMWILSRVILEGETA